MSNKINHRRGDKHTSDRHDVASSCCGEGANGQRGRARWKKWSNRAERRTGVRPGKIGQVKRSSVNWGAKRKYYKD
jgi:hypothetical protein